MPLDADSLRRLYQEMLRCRLVGTRITDLFGWPALGGVREAITVGSAIDLQADDLYLSALGSYASALVRGASVAAVLSACKARSVPSASGHGLAAGSEILLATGAALAVQLRGSSHLVTVVASQVPTTLEPWSEALRFAAARRLPVIYVIEVPAGRSSLRAADLRSQAASYGLPGFTVDGHDLVAVLRVCQEARQKARQGYGPTLIECCTFADSATAKHPMTAPHLVQHRQNADPIDAMRHYLERRHHWDASWHQQIVQHFERELSAAEKSLAPAARGKGRAALQQQPQIAGMEKGILAEMEIFARPAKVSPRKR